MTEMMMERVEELQALHGLVIDMDGVLWRDDHPMGGLQEFFAALRRRGMRFVLATNNNTRKPAGFVEKLAHFGVEINENEVITASVVTVEYLKGKYPPGTPVHVLAEQPFKDLVADAGYPLVDSGPAAVVVSMDRQVNYDKLRVASLLIRQGAEFIGANPDVVYPTPQGLAPGERDADRRRGGLLRAAAGDHGQTRAVDLPHRPQAHGAAGGLHRLVGRSLEYGYPGSTADWDAHDPGVERGDHASGSGQQPDPAGLGLRQHRRPGESLVRSPTAGSEGKPG